MGTKKGSKKRFWSDDEKRSICLQARVPGVSVAQVARRSAMNANLIHNWLRDERFAPEDSDCVLDGAAFLPVEIEARRPHQATRSRRLPRICRCRLSGLISRCRTGGGYWWKGRRRCRRCWLWLKV
ncbi:transposase [Roseibium sp. TrichSKD4]|uniref:transposase n=1 Tax=Roseibium sp. TrichSKD4 TaxID=744980 RepID=UPI001AD92CC9|nr:transposase [Roseibium sp. TrichSKD4]